MSVIGLADAMNLCMVFFASMIFKDNLKVNDKPVSVVPFGTPTLVVEMQPYVTENVLGYGLVVFIT